jgi:Glycosyl transferase family 2
VPEGQQVVPVVMCLWKRLDRLERTIRLLANQTYRSVELHLWNNDPASRGIVDEIVSETKGLSIDVVHSSWNVGSFGRFYLARELAPTQPRVIILDDDQTFSESLVSTLVDEFEPRTLTGFWAFNFTAADEYGARVAARPGERVKYCGPGGMIADSTIFLEPGLYRCPRRFWYADDLWLSYYADHVLGWELRKSRVDITMDNDDLDQFRYLYPTKTRLLTHLVRAGWDVLETQPS